MRDILFNRHGRDLDLECCRRLSPLTISCVFVTGKDGQVEIEEVVGRSSYSDYLVHGYVHRGEVHEFEEKPYAGLQRNATAISNINRAASTLVSQQW